MAARRSISIWFRVTFTASKHFRLYCAVLCRFIAVSREFLCVLRTLFMIEIEERFVCFYERFNEIGWVLK